MRLKRYIAVGLIARMVLVPGLMLVPALASGGAEVRAPSVSVRVDGEPSTAADMLERLRKRGARQGITVVADEPAFQLRIFVLVRGPQWQQVLGVSAAGAVAVLDARGELLFMHLRQKEATTGGAMDDMADEILRRLPALLRGEKMLTR